MNIAFVTGHPAQVHNFRILKEELEKADHRVFWLASDKDISKYLLDYYKIKYQALSRPGKTIFSKFYILIINTFYVLNFIRTNQIDFAISRVSPYVSIACWLLRKTHIALTDTESARFYDKLFGNLVTALFTSRSYKLNLRKDQIRFDANIEMFYLHPSRYKPRFDIYPLLGVKEGDPYIVMRYVSWDAYHDKGLSGFTDANKINAVKLLEKYGKVFISSEKKLPEDLASYGLKIPPEMIHDVLANAKLFIGESATMASESAVLGTPAIFLNDNWFGSTEQETEYGLMYSFKCDLIDQEKAINKSVELLSNPNLKKQIEEKRKLFLASKIDVTALFLWLIENWPESLKILKEDPDYQYRFR